LQDVIRNFIIDPFECYYNLVDYSDLMVEGRTFYSKGRISIEPDQQRIVLSTATDAE